LCLALWVLLRVATSDDVVHSEIGLGHVWFHALIKFVTRFKMSWTPKPKFLLRVVRKGCYFSSDQKFLKYGSVMVRAMWSKKERLKSVRGFKSSEQ
jgi:hypothetical protein